MKHLNYFSILLVFFVLTSCNSKESNNSKNLVSYNGLVGEWYLMEKKTNSTVDSTFFQDGIKWKIFSDSTVLRTYHKQQYRSYSGPVMMSPGPIYLMKIILSSSTNELTLGNEDEDIKYKVIEFNNDKMVLENIKTQVLIKLKR